MKYADAVSEINSLIDKDPRGCVAPLLPLLFRLNNAPYDLDWSHFMMRPMFRTKMMSRRMLWRTARQVSKSTSLGASKLVRAAITNNYNILTVMPLFEQVRKFSQNVVRPFISTSPVKSLFSDPEGSNSVLQRNMRNGSMLFYSYSSGDPNRIRGIQASECLFDECVTASAKALTPVGPISVALLAPGDEICSFNPVDNALITDTVTAVVRKGVRPVWRITTESGASLDCTDNEKLWTTHGWVYLSQIMHGKPDNLADIVSDVSGVRRFELSNSGPIAFCRAVPRKDINENSNTVACKIFVLDRQVSLIKDKILPQSNYIDGISLKEDSVASIEYIGEEDVYDIETRLHHTLILNGMAVHNCQDMDISDMPIIEACMSASKYKVARYTGTPKTFDNTIQLLWEDSSQAIWHIPCQETGCKYVNSCTAKDGDLLNMLGDKTLICAKCGKPVNSRLGFYVHGIPSRQLTFAGYHVSQPILPMHYESPKDWALLLEFRREKPAYAFFNEVLGEPYDAGAKLITFDQLKAACVVPPAQPAQAAQGRYIATALGVDWGGRGKEKTSDSEEFVSNTAIAYGGMLPDGTVEITWLHKVPYTIDTADESQIVVNAAMSGGCQYIGMDYGGQGNVQEAFVKSRGWPAERIFPFTYSVLAPTKPIVFYSPPAGRGVRSSFTLDKPRSLLLLCELIKRGMVKLPASDAYLQDHLKDFLNILEESTDNPRGSPRKLVKRMSRRTDDIVHAVNFVVMTLFHSLQAWPSLANAFIESEKS